jgi:uncharacterized protein (DUF433 family)
VSIRGVFEVTSFRPGKFVEPESEVLPPPLFKFRSMLVPQCLNLRVTIKVLECYSHRFVDCGPRNPRQATHRSSRETHSPLHASACRTRFAVSLTRAYALSTMNWQDYISITPGVRSGKPCVKGTRITVSDVLEYLASGMDEQTILTDFPELRREHIQAVLSFAAERERRLSALPAVS